MIAEVGQEPRLNVCFSILLDRHVFCLCIVMRAGLTKSLLWGFRGGGQTVLLRELFADAGHVF